MADASSLTGIFVPFLCIFLLLAFLRDVSCLHPDKFPRLSHPSPSPKFRSINLFKVKPLKNRLVSFKCIKLISDVKLEDEPSVINTPFAFTCPVVWSTVGTPQKALPPALSPLAFVFCLSEGIILLQAYPLSDMIFPPHFRPPLFLPFFGLPALTSAIFLFVINLQLSQKHQQCY